MAENTEFKPINTQEEFDSMIKSRLERERNKVSEQFNDYDNIKTLNEELKTQKESLSKALTEANEKNSSIEKQLAEKDSIIAKYELDSVKTRIANEYKLDFEAVKFLQGTTEEEIKSSAESLKALVGNKEVMPMAVAEPVATEQNTKKQALKDMSKNLMK